MNIASISNASSLLLVSASSTSPLTPKTIQSQSPTAAQNTLMATDTYTPGNQTQSVSTADLSSGNATTSNGYSSTQSANPSATQGTILSAAYLAQNQVISGAQDVRIALLEAMPSGDPVQEAWTQLNNSVFAGDLSGAQTALTNYTQALQNSNYSMSSLSAPTTKFMNELTAIGTAIQGGDLSQVKAAYLTAQQDVPEGVGGYSLAYDSGNTAGVVSLTQEAEANMADGLVTLGYTPENALAEANAIAIGAAIDSQTQSTESDQTKVEQWITGLSEAIAKNTFSVSDNNRSATVDLASSIYTSILSTTTISSMKLTLATLDAAYGTSNSSSNAVSSSSGSPANVGSNADVNT